jgi:hypothetical protein
MFLATTALLLHFLALPSNAVPATTAEAALATSEAASVQPDAILSAAAEPDPNVTYTPGSLVLEPVAPVEPIAYAEPSAFVGNPSAPLISSATVETERRWEQRQKRIWMALNVTQSAAATFDAWSTRRVISSGQGQELNPLLRPFAGNNSLYAAIQVGPLLLDYVGRRMMTSHHSWARHTWWVPQAVGTAISLTGGMNNLAVESAR